MYGGDSGYRGGSNFFDFLFGGGSRQIQEPVYRPRGSIGRRADDNRRIITR
jgi:hypothetical protein